MQTLYQLYRKRYINVHKTFACYLGSRHQRVKANQLTSAWKQLNGAMPQDSWLGPLSFLALINDLTTGCLIHKYVNDTTLTEILESKKPGLIHASFRREPVGLG